MKPRERFIAALRRQPVDRVPMFDFLFQKPLYTDLIGRTPESYNARDAVDCSVALDLDAIWIPYGCFSGWRPEHLSDNVYKDEWGTTFQKGEASWPIDAPIDYPIKTPADLQTYQPPDAATEGRLNDIDAAIAHNRELGSGAVAILGGVGGPLTTTWMLTGYESICTSLYDSPDFLRAMARVAVDFSIVAATRMAEAGVDGMIVSEDLGASAGGLMAPDPFRKVFKEPLGELISHIKGLNLPVLLHSCGCIYDYLDDLVELGIDAIHPLQRTAGMDLKLVKEKYGHRICIVGNIDSSRTLPFGSKEDIEKEVREALKIAAPGYGYVLASDHSLHDGISVGNIKWMFEIGRKYGKYPASATLGSDTNE